MEQVRMNHGLWMPLTHDNHVDAMTENIGANGVAVAAFFMRVSLYGWETVSGVN